jgi:light-regulated signal transduction histidine kinase (bacteriophytochrome)
MTELSENKDVDLTECDREPIHVPGRVQPHGVLLVLRESDLNVLHASENAGALLGIPASQMIGWPVDRVIGASGAKAVRSRLSQESIEANPSYVGTITVPGQDGALHAIVHRFKSRLFLELEPALSREEITFGNLYSLVRTATGRLKGASSITDLCQIAADQIRQISGFDRVMIYQFAADWSGLVVAESKIEQWSSYLDLRFPASDIPKQARQLYLLNRLRLIVDVAAQPAPLVPPRDEHTHEPVDLSHALLRAVSPVHIEYLKNMGVGASMSISIVKDDRLWGLIAAHHRTARRLSYEVRAACEHLAEIAALQLAAKAYAQGADRRIALKAIQSRLLAQMAAYENFVDGLVRDPAELLALASAAGCAVLFEGALHLRGSTPSEAQVRELIDWLKANHGDADIFHTDKLSADYPAAQEFKESASGILSIAISRFRGSYIVWFRPEVIDTVRWAGDPNKPLEANARDFQKLHPRRSFETWKQTVVGKSRPWSDEEIAAAGELREAVVGIILRKAEELASLNAELRRSNRELEAFSYSVSHDLRAPFRHIFGFSDLLQKRASPSLDETSRRYIKTIMDSAKYAGTLVDSLLAFSQMSRTALKPQSIDMGELVGEVQAELMEDAAGRQIDWRISPLPVVFADLMMMKLVIRNLLSNAIKYSRKRERAVIEIGCRDEGEMQLFWVRDNGVGFDMQFKDKLFGVFQRLHRVEEFEGTGIGLANVWRMVERHGGRVWAEGKVDAGATFFFTLPRPTEGQAKENN